MTPEPNDQFTGSSLGRRGFLVGATMAGAAMAVRTPAAHATPAPSPLPLPGGAFRRALSVSPFTTSMLARGLSYTDGAMAADSLEEVQRLFVAHGSNEMFARIATRRVAVQERDAQHGFKRGLEVARLARKLGLPFNPELGLWNVYGDISHQPGPDFSDYPQIQLPGPWETLTLHQMTAAMRQYGAMVARQILATGAEVEVWDLGNEVEFGVAGVALPSFISSTDYWSYSAPDAVDPEIGATPVYSVFGMPDRNAWLSEHLWPYVGAIFKAVADGIRSVDPHARFSTHTSTVALLLPGLLEAFYQAMDDAGFEVAELGVSYYPTNSPMPNALASFKSTASALKERFGKQVFIAETGYPSARMGQPFEWNSAVPGYPLNPAGEYEFFRDLTAWGASSGVVAGIRPWAPDYAVGLWEPMSYFAVDGSVAVAQPVLDAIRDGLIAAG